jgi:hypothetical protein
MRIFLKQLLASGLAVLAIAGVAQGEDLRSYPPSTMNTSEAAVAVVPRHRELRCTATIRNAPWSRRPAQQTARINWRASAIWRLASRHGLIAPS